MRTARGKYVQSRRSGQGVCPAVSRGAKVEKRFWPATIRVKLI
jgi:hypothetical protein